MATHREGAFGEGEGIGEGVYCEDSTADFSATGCPTNAEFQVGLIFGPIYSFPVASHLFFGANAKLHSLVRVGGRLTRTHIIHTPGDDMGFLNPSTPSRREGFEDHQKPNLSRKNRDVTMAFCPGHSYTLTPQGTGHEAGMWWGDEGAEREKMTRDHR